MAENTAMTSMSPLALLKTSSIVFFKKISFLEGMIILTFAIKCSRYDLVYYVCSAGSTKGSSVKPLALIIYHFPSSVVYTVFPTKYAPSRAQPEVTSVDNARYAGKESIEIKVKAMCPPFVARQK